MRIKHILVIPPGHPGRADPRVDEVRVDEDADRPYLLSEEVPEDSDTSVDRAFINDSTKKRVADAIAAYETESAKTTPDPQVQLAELEKAISFMWDVVSGEDVGAEAAREANSTQ